MPTAPATSSPLHARDRGHRAPSAPASHRHERRTVPPRHQAHCSLRSSRGLLPAPRHGHESRTFAHPPATIRTGEPVSPSVLARLHATWHIPSGARNLTHSAPRTTRVITRAAPDRGINIRSSLGAGYHPQGDKGMSPNPATTCHPQGVSAPRRDRAVALIAATVRMGHESRAGNDVLILLRVRKPSSG